MIFSSSKNKLDSFNNKAKDLQFCPCISYFDTKSLFKGSYSVWKTQTNYISLSVIL